VSALVIGVCGGIADGELWGPGELLPLAAAPGVWAALVIFRVNDAVSDANRLGLGNLVNVNVGPGCLGCARWRFRAARGCVPLHEPRERERRHGQRLIAGTVESRSGRVLRASGPFPPGPMKRPCPWAAPPDRSRTTSRLADQPKQRRRCRPACCGFQVTTRARDATPGGRRPVDEYGCHWPARDASTYGGGARRRDRRSRP
jgi:hypothetical protein